MNSMFLIHQVYLLSRCRTTFFKKDMKHSIKTCIFLIKIKTLFYYLLKRLAYTLNALCHATKTKALPMMNLSTVYTVKFAPCYFPPFFICKRFRPVLNSPKQSCV